MKELEFNVEIAEEADKTTLAEIAEEIRAALAEDTTVKNPAAVPIKGSRGAAEVAAVIAVAISVAVDIDNALKAVEGIIARFRKIFSKSEKKSEQILAGLDPCDIFINVDGALVPMCKLTKDHVAWLRSH